MQPDTPNFAHYNNEAIGMIPFTIDEENKVWLVLGLKQPNFVALTEMSWDWLGSKIETQNGNLCNILSREIIDETGNTFFLPDEHSENKFIGFVNDSKFKLTLNPVDISYIWLVLKFVPYGKVQKQLKLINARLTAKHEEHATMHVKLGFQLFSLDLFTLAIDNDIGLKCELQGATENQYYPISTFLKLLARNPDFFHWMKQVESASPFTSIIPAPLTFTVIQ